jgi:glutaredoxin 3
MADVTIYVTAWCPYCVRARALLDRKKVPYTAVDVDGDSAKRAWLAQATGQRTVPQTFIDGRPVGGCDDLHALDRRGELDRLLGLA